MGDLVVRFDAGGGDEGPLSWGQAQCWRAMVETGSSLAMGQLMPFPAGGSAEHLVDVLRFWVERYAALRTTLRFDRDAVTQVVHPHGELPVRLVEAGSEDPAAVAERVLAEWKAQRFDYEREWPVRAAAVTCRGVATHAVIVLCHLAADGAGIAVMGRELAERDAGRGPGAGPYGALQPVQLARQQADGAARQCAASLRFWESQLRGLPARRLAAPVERGGPRFRRVVWESGALHAGARAAAAQFGTDTAPVLLAAFALALHQVTGASPVAAQVIVGNRFRPGLADVVSPLVQSGLAVLDVAGASLADAVGRAVRATMQASKYAYYDPAARQALFDRVDAERGEHVELGVLWNDRRMSDGPTVPAPTAVVREEPMAFFNEQLMVNVEDVPGTVRLLVELDTWHLSRPDLAALLAAMEAAVSTPTRRSPGS